MSGSFLIFTTVLSKVNMAKILLVEDDGTFARILENFLIKQGHQVAIVNNLALAQKAITGAISYDLMLLDYRLPDGTGMDMLSRMRKEGVIIPVIIMTSFHDVRTAVKAIKNGAYDYVTKPVNPDELLMRVNEALTRKSEPVSHTLNDLTFVEGQSEASALLHEHIQLVGPTNMSVIILGESGTGKEQVARRIHLKSNRNKYPFVAIDCGALSTELAASELFGHAKGAFTGALHDKKGQFEIADGGTLFLDEIGNLSYDVQVKLLRVLQERTVQPVGSNKQIKTDVRIIAATNDDLTKSISKESFREDLYHRLNEFKIKLAPLRERREDLGIFIEHFISLSNKELGKEVKSVSPEVFDLFSVYDWPGNLRELKNVIKRAVLLVRGDQITKEVLPDEMIMEAEQMHERVVTAGSDLKAIKEINEREIIIKTLQEVRYNKAKASRLLNIDRKTLYLKMEKYGIS